MIYSNFIFYLISYPFSPGLPGAPIKDKWKLICDRLWNDFVWLSYHHDLRSLLRLFDQLRHNLVHLFDRGDHIDLALLVNLVVRLSLVGLERKIFFVKYELIEKKTSNILPFGPGKPGRPASPRKWKKNDMNFEVVHFFDFANL